MVDLFLRCSSKLQLLEWVSSEAVTSILHKLIEQRMEQHCRGEYERSFLLEFQEVKHPPSVNDNVKSEPIISCWLLSVSILIMFCVSSGWSWCWAG